MTNHKLLPLLLIAALTLSLGALLPIRPVHAAGTLYVFPSPTAVMAVGSTFTEQIRVSNMDPFNAWDIQVMSDNTVISPQSLTITPNTLTANFSITVFELINCINSVGTGCTALDGPGIVHSAVTAFGPPPATASSGILFTITYKVMSTGPFSLIAPFNDVLANGATGQAVVHVTLNGVYGTPPPPPDFGIAASPNPTIQAGASGTTTVTLTALNGFTGIVTVTASSASGITATPSPNAVTLPPSPSSYTLTIMVAATVVPSTYTLTLTGVSGALTHTAAVTITVTPPPAQDFSLTASPTSLSIDVGLSGTSTITLASINGFAGSVGVTASSATAGITASCSPNSVPLPPSPNTCLLTINVASSVPIGTIATVTVTGMSGALSHTTSITVTVVFSHSHFVHGKLSWTHHLSLAKNPCSAPLTGDCQTFTAHVRDEGSTPEWVVITVDGSNGVGGSFHAQSAPQLLSPGIVTDVTFSQTVDPALVNTKICFTAKLYFGATAAEAMALTNLGPNSKSGCMAIVP